MVGPRIYISYSSNDTFHIDSSLVTRLVNDLRATGTDLEMSPGNDINDDLVQHLMQVLPGCQWLIVIQTAESLLSPKIQVEVSMALNLVMQGRMRGVLAVIAEPHDLQEAPPIWSTLKTFDASKDYPRALARILLALGLTDTGTPHYMPSLSPSFSPPVEPMSSTTDDTPIGSPPVWKNMAVYQDTGDRPANQLLFLKSEAGSNKHHNGFKRNLLIIAVILLIVLVLVSSSIAVAWRQTQSTHTTDPQPTHMITHVSNASTGTPSQPSPTIVPRQTSRPSHSPTPTITTTTTAVPTVLSQNPSPTTPVHIPPTLTVSPANRINNFSNCSWDTHGGVGQDISCPFVVSNSARTQSVLNWSVSANDSTVIFSTSSGTLAPGQSITVTMTELSGCPLNFVLLFHGSSNTVQAPFVCTQVSTSPYQGIDNTQCTHDNNWTCVITVTADSANSEDTPWTVYLQTPDPAISFSPSQGTLAPGASVPVTITIPGTDCPTSNLFLFEVPNSLPGPGYESWSC